MRFLVLGCFLLSLAAPWPASALGLEWSKGVVTIDAEPDQKKVETEFPFRNDGDRPITIQSVTTSCGCTTAALDKKTYAPGERGKIQIVFTVGERTGLQEKSIQVQTDDPRMTDPVELLLRVNIKSYLDFEPHIIVWNVGDQPTEKIITCTALLSAPVTLTAAYSTSPAFTARIETVQTGRKYLIHLKPASTAKQVNATIPLSFTISSTQGPQTRSFDAFACVSAPTDFRRTN